MSERVIDTHKVYMFLKSLEAHGVTCDTNIECIGDELIPGLQVTYQNKFKFFPTPLSALPWMQERYREDLTELLGDLALPLVEKDEKMSETPEQYGNQPKYRRVGPGEDKNAIIQGPTISAEEQWRIADARIRDLCMKLILRLYTVSLSDDYMYIKVSKEGMHDLRIAMITARETNTEALLNWVEERSQREI